MELFRHDRKLYHWTGDDWIGSQITWDEIIRVIWQDLICHLSNILFHHIFWHKSASILRNTHWQNAKPLFLFLTRKGVVLYEQEVQGQKKMYFLFHFITSNHPPRHPPFLSYSVKIIIFLHSCCEHVFF